MKYYEIEVINLNDFTVVNTMLKEFENGEEMADFVVSNSVASLSLVPTEIKYGEYHAKKAETK